MDSYAAGRPSASTTFAGFNRSGAMFWIPTALRQRRNGRFCRVSIAQARCFGFLLPALPLPLTPRERFQSLRRDVFGFLPCSTKKPMSTSRCFNRSGAMFWIPTQKQKIWNVQTKLVSIAQARCFGFPTLTFDVDK